MDGSTEVKELNAKDGHQKQTLTDEEIIGNAFIFLLGMTSWLPSDVLPR